MNELEFIERDSIVLVLNAAGQFIGSIYRGCPAYFDPRGAGYILTCNQMREVLRKMELIQNEARLPAKKEPQHERATTDQ